MSKRGIRSKKYVKLQERDLEMFRWISQQKFASRSQLAKQFFPNQAENPSRPERVCYRRLLTLARFDLLETRHVVTDATQLYQVGKPALSELAHRGEAVLPYLRSIDLKNYQHDLCVNEFRIAMQWSGATDWQSERCLRRARGRGQIPDAVFTMGINRCALEMELSLKRRDRYPKILRSYADDHTDIDVVLYVCGNAAVRDTIERMARDSRRFHFALWDDFVRDEGQTKFENQSGRVRPLEML